MQSILGWIVNSKKKNKAHNKSEVVRPKEKSTSFSFFLNFRENQNSKPTQIIIHEAMSVKDDIL